MPTALPANRSEYIQRRIGLSIYILPDGEFWYHGARPSIRGFLLPHSPPVPGDGHAGGWRFSKTVKSLFAFWKESLRNLRQTGALLPSSGSLSRALIAPLRNRTESVRVLEAGAGTGAVTREILGSLRAGDSLVVYEMNPGMRRALESVVEKGRAGGNSFPEVRIVGRPVETIDPDERFDHIISGLPFNNFAPAKVEEILDLFFRLCRDRGTLSYFEYIGMRALRRFAGNRTGRQRVRALDAVVDRSLARHGVERRMVFWNFPPAWVRHLKK